MSFILGGTTIRTPNGITEGNSTQEAINRTINGSVNSDLFGSNKRVWQFSYNKCKKTDYDTINTIYQSYLLLGTPKSLQSTEANYTIASTNVHVKLTDRNFSVGGSNYLSDFTLTLIEA